MALQLLQPFSGRPGAGDYGYSFDISPRPSAPSGPTAQQLLRRALAEEKEDEGQSFWDKVKAGTGSVLSKALDIILRPHYAVTGFVSAAGGGKKDFTLGDFVDPDSWRGSWRGLKGEHKESFGELLEQEGYLKGHGRLRGLAGFALDVIFDPLNLLLFGAAPIAVGTAGIKGARTAALALRKVGRPNVATSEAKLTEIRNAANRVKFARIDKLDPELGTVRAYADALHSQADMYLKGITPSKFEQEAMFRELVLSANRMETQIKKAIPRVVQAKVRIPLTRGKYVPLTPTTIGGKRVAPLAPSYFRTAGGAGVLGHIPGLPPVLRGIGERFKPGAADELASAKLGARHIEELNAKVYTAEIEEGLKPFRGMDPEDQFDAVAWYDETENVVLGPADESIRTLNEEALAESGLSRIQQAFVRFWHDIMENMRQRDRAYNMFYEVPENGRGYVPHLYNTDIIQVISKSALRTPRHMRPRIRKDMTIRAIRENKEELKELGISEKILQRVADEPIELLYLHTRQASRAHAEAALRRVVAKSYGVPYHVPDAARVMALDKALMKFHNYRESLAAQTGEEFRRITSNTQKSQKGKEFAQQRNEAVRKAQEAKAQADDRLAELEARFQTAEEVRIANSGAPNQLDEMLRMSDRRIKEEVESGRITPQTAKVMRQIRSKIRKKSASKAEMGPFWKDYLKSVSGERIPWNAVRTNILRGRENIDDRLAERIAKIEGKKEEAFVKIDEAVAKQIGKTEKELDRVVKRILTHEGRRTRALTAKVNPEVAKHKLVELASPSIEAELGTSFAVPHRIQESIGRIDRILANDDAIQQFDTMWNKLTALWKSFVTVVNPGYRMRNTASDWWNMLIDGVPFWAIPAFGARAIQLLVRAKNGNEAAIRTLDEAYVNGVLSGQFTGDIETVSAIGRYGPYQFMHQKGAWSKTGVPTALRAAHTFNRQAENWGRLTHYLYRLEFEKMSPSEAAERVRAAHFDYEELTPFEQQRMKKIAPFYTWTRKNIPYQIQQIISRPGRVTILPKFAYEMEYAAGGGEEDIVPDYIKENFGFKLPIGEGSTYLTPQIGFVDLAKLENPENFAQLLHPVPKVVGEVVTGESFLTGAPIQGTHPRSPIADPLGITSGLISKIPGADVGQTQRQIRDEEVTGLGASPWVSYIFGQLPLTNQFFVRQAEIKRAQKGVGGSASMFSYLGGVSMVELDQEMGELIAQMEFEEEFRRYLRGLRDEDRFPEPEEDGFSEFEEQIRMLINESVRR